MIRNTHVLSKIFVAAAVLALGVAASTGWAENGLRTAEITWNDAVAWIQQSDAKSVIELADAIIRVEVNDTDGDAGFQIELDGEGWRTVWVFGPNGGVILRTTTANGVKNIGGGTELFLETSEPEYDDLDGLQDLLDLLDEGDYMFLARTTGGDWAFGEAELTHTIPAGPEIVMPLPEPGADCAEDVLVDFAVIEWDPVEETIQGSPDVEVVGYQVIVEAEDDPPRKMDLIVPADRTMVTVPAAILDPDTEYKFEILALEESDNQTITESCFVTAE
jgi:hypothetical protein